MLRGVLGWKPRTVLICGALLVGAIAVCDWRVEFNATLGFLYIFPLALFGTVLDWWALLLIAAFCTFLSDRLDPFPMDIEEARDLLIFLTLGTTGLLSRGVTRSFRAEVKSRARLQEEGLARKTAEGQLEFLIESSPAAVVTMNSKGEVLFANPAAHRLFAVTDGNLQGRNVSRYIEALGSISVANQNSGAFRTEMQTRGRRENGEVFLADVSFSTYNTPAGPRLSALIVDASESLREREEASLEQLLAGSRILVAAVSHEVRNVCGAIGMMHENLARRRSLEGDEDFDALGSLVETLKKIASLELNDSVRTEPIAVDLNEVLTDLHIVLAPFCEESDIQLEWDVPENLPIVQADRHRLLQVLLNLARNSQRALEPMPEMRITVSARSVAGQVSIRFSDNGPGIPPGLHLFQPLQKGAQATGLGLYLSRAFMRSFRGELRHDADHAGCSFVLDLLEVTSNTRSEDTREEHGANSTLIAR
jgi:two-component system, LuxR family, sensor kinase FixL